MLRITRDQQVYDMSGGHPPAARCSGGSTVVFETKDAYGDFLQRDEQVWSKIQEEMPQYNPAAGPLYVEGARPGDVLRVEIQEIVLGDTAAMCVALGFGPFGDVMTQERTKIIPVKDGKLYYNDKVTLEVKEMVGVIGTAPAEGSIQNMYPGPHGANMDCTRIRTGSVLFLPVNVPGALLSIGDLHAAMGNGESLGCGAEIDGEVKVKVDVLKDTDLPLPMVIDGGDLVVVATGETLNDAANLAVHQMFKFLNGTAGFDSADTACLISLEGNLSICQIVNPLYSVMMSFPLSVMEQNGYVFSL